MKAVSEPYPVSITGCLFAWRLDEEQPVIVYVNDHPWLSVFSTETLLHDTMKRVNARPYRLKVVDDGVEFLASVGQLVDVCLDLRLNDTGKIFLKRLLPERPTNS